MSLENLEKLPELIFVYSPESELSSIIITLERNSRHPYTEQGYQPRLPRGVVLGESEFGKEFDDEILDKIKAEFDEDKISKAKRYEEFIRKNWPEIVDKLKRLFTEIDLPLPNYYKIQFTDYGVGGRFFPPCKILIRFENELIIESLKNVIIHEAIHNAIEPLNIKYKISSIEPGGHWVRELLVDRLMRKVAPNIEPHKMALKNLSPERVEKIDSIFNQNYPNLEKILEEISKLRETNI